MPIKITRDQVNIYDRRIVLARPRVAAGFNIFVIGRMPLYLVRSQVRCLLGIDGRGQTYPSRTRNASKATLSQPTEERDMKDVIYPRLDALICKAQ
jgi:hypothetical protein